ncbi:MAG: hypothetical protein GX663_05185 [Clostridiales bacterium]|nr:hypothetical protein [Clostridiales bacterium]
MPVVYDEIVFYGYGEPTKRMDTMLEIAKHIKQLYRKPIRLNTIGLADLIYGYNTAVRLEGFF